MRNDFVKAQYNKLAENYLAGRHQFQNLPYLEKLNELLKPNSEILDVGCGAGVPIDKYFIDHGHRVTGIDISEKQIELAKKHLPEGIFKVQDMTELAVGEYAVDAVVSFYALFHTDRKTHKDTLRTMYSCLRPGGYLLISMGASDWEGTDDNFFGGKMEWSHYGKEDNTRLVKEAGFHVILAEIDTHGRESHLMVMARR